LWREDIQTSSQHDGELGEGLQNAEWTVGVAENLHNPSLYVQSTYLLLWKFLSRSLVLDLMGPPRALTLSYLVFFFFVQKVYGVVCVIWFNLFHFLCLCS